MDETFEYNMRAHRLGYFDTKREAEELVLAFARSQSQSPRSDSAPLAQSKSTSGQSAPLEIVVLCPSNVYGRGDALKASRGTQVKVARGRLPFYSGGGINIVRVQDVAEAFVAAWHKGLCACDASVHPLVYTCLESCRPRSHEINLLRLDFFVSQYSCISFVVFCFGLVFASIDTGRHGERYIIGGDNVTVRELLGMYAAAAGVAPPRWQLPPALMLLAGHLGILPLEVTHAIF